MSDIIVFWSFMRFSIDAYPEKVKRFHGILRFLYSIFIMWENFIYFSFAPAKSRQIRRRKTPKFFSLLAQNLTS
ncbi:MAG: hypothetical protein LBC26_01930 [Oscillospiraceae bacterium]|nr:hypothetical protein [Oscillospiraceae bacterium]